MPTTLTEYEQIKPANVDELKELLDRNHISTDGWGTNGIHSIEKLLKTLRENHVYFVQPPRLNGARHPLTLHVHCAVVIVWYMSTPLRELYEKRQIFPDGHVIDRSGTFNGLGETLNWNDGYPEDPDSGAHRLLCEELGQSQPLFKERVRYQCFHKETTTLGPIPHDKWPFLGVFHRNVKMCEIPHGSPLYLPDGYVEVEKPEDGGRRIEFAWRDVDRMKTS
ncbi:MAG: hypothetical protein KBC33_00555 [Candidatus Pacebacteria bacterium]|nr:hypothetical protein [Candidatus Paceibacterota bacterium]